MHIDLVQGSVLAVDANAPPSVRDGLRVGDVIVGVDGRLMAAHDVLSHVQQCEKTTFTVLRGWKVSL